MRIWMFVSGGTPGFVSSTTRSLPGTNRSLFQSVARNERIGCPSEAAAASAFCFLASPDAGHRGSSIVCACVRSFRCGTSVRASTA